MKEDKEKNNEKAAMMINEDEELSKQIIRKNYRNSIVLELVRENNDIEGLRRPSLIIGQEKEFPEEDDADQDFDEMYRSMPLTDETTCGFLFIRGSLLQKCANKKIYVLLYGLLGCVFGATYAYSTAVLTTVEKRFKIPSRTTGTISVAGNISQICVSMLLSYYGGKYHRPRCLMFGMYTVVIFCLMTASLHFIWGPGEDSLELTKEYGGIEDQIMSKQMIDSQKRKTLCQLNGSKCKEEDSMLSPQILLFIAKFIGGIGSSLYYSLGTTYMDDNIKKSKIPVLVSISYFMRMLGPAIGYGVGTYCLKLYIAPTLNPTITNQDPRWLGAWWLGWLMMAGLVFFFATLIGLFPKTLPRAAVRRVIAAEKEKKEQKVKEPKKASFSDMVVTYKRLMRNKTLLCNNFSTIFYFFGETPYWIFMPKYIETIYRQTASTASFVTGTIGLVFSAIGILVAGVVISTFKPRARYLAGWNVCVGIISALGMFSYMYLGCEAEDNTLQEARVFSFNMTRDCNADCNCDFIPYTPICGVNNKTFISPCHAGCRDFYEIPESRRKVYTQCSCIPNLRVARDVVSSTKQTISPDYLPSTLASVSTDYQSSYPDMFSKAFQGPCPVDCQKVFYMFLGVMCVLKFIGASGRASNFLVSVRCVDETDKPAAVGFNTTLMSFFALIPAPIVFGYLLDTMCIVWGKNCSGKGNCWLYDGQTLRVVIATTSATFVMLGAVFDAGVWYYVKNLKIFDDDEKENKKKLMMAAS